MINKPEYVMKIARETAEILQQCYPTDGVTATIAAAIEKAIHEVPKPSISTNVEAAWAEYVGASAEAHQAFKNWKDLVDNEAANNL
jgi:hypothetical protein